MGIFKEDTFKKRLKKLQGLLAEHKINGMLITNTTNFRYLTGLTSSSFLLIVCEKGGAIKTDFRYIEEVRKKAPFLEIFQSTSEPAKDLKKILKKLKIRRLGFEPENVTYETYKFLKDVVGKKQIKPVSGIVENLRMIKEPEEVVFIRKAVRLAEKGFRYVRGLLKPGVTENEIATELELYLKANGGDKISFETIVAFGPNSAVPHHSTGTKRLREKDMVLIDWGVKIHGYSCDLTRTLLSHSMSKKEREIYRIVLEAQKAAIEKIKPGIILSGIDRIARDHIASHGYREAFGHSFGHGIGMDVHELPGVSRKSTVICRKGMVITAEPGIYIPGWGGVRIEDDVLVTGKGHEVLSSLSRTAEPF